MVMSAYRFRALHDDDDGSPMHGYDGPTALRKREVQKHNTDSGDSTHHTPLLIRVSVKCRVYAKHLLFILEKKIAVRTDTALTVIFSALKTVTPAFPVSSKCKNAFVDATTQSAACKNAFYTLSVDTKIF